MNATATHPAPRYHVGPDSPEAKQILEAIDRWLVREVEPHVMKFEHDDIWPAQMVEQMKELGLFGATISPEYGGLGLSAELYGRIVTRISEVWMSLTGIFNSHLMMALLTERYGSEALKKKYLPKFASGEIRGGLALTEPNAGTDLQAIRTKAVKTGNDYVLNGTKTWISNGIQGSCFAVLVKTNPEAEPRHKGMTMFLCEKGPGFTASKKLEKIGYKGIDSAELVFDDYKISADNLIGEEGRGFHQAVGGLELGRINVASRGVGIAAAALSEAVKYSQQRHTFGKPICEHQAIQLKIGEMATRVEAARLLVKNAAQIYDRGERCDMEAGMAKLFASEVGMEIALNAVRIHGGYGYSTEYDVERYFRDAPLMIVGEGTNEIQRNVIAAQLVARGGL